MPSLIVAWVATVLAGLAGLVGVLRLQPQPASVRVTTFALAALVPAAPLMIQSGVAMMVGGTTSTSYNVFIIIPGLCSLVFGPLALAKSVVSGSSSELATFAKFTRMACAVGWVLSSTAVVMTIVSV